MLAEGKAVEAQRDSFMKKDFKTFTSLSKDVNFKNKGNGGGGTDDKTLSDPVLEIDRLVQIKLKEDKGLSYGDAVEKVLSENKKLNEDYNKKFTF